MGWFAGLVLMQVVVFYVCAIGLRQVLPGAVSRIIRKNSIRMDGSFSQRRKNIELESLDHSFIRIYVGMGLVFFLTLVVGVVIIGATIVLPNLDANSGVEIEPMKLSGVGSSNDVDFTIIVVYALSTLLVAPILIVNLYQSAIRQYMSRANSRFVDYYRHECVDGWENQDRPSRKKRRRVTKRGESKRRSDVMR